MCVQYMCVYVCIYMYRHTIYNVMFGFLRSSLWNSSECHSGSLLLKCISALISTLLFTTPLWTSSNCTQLEPGIWSCQNKKNYISSINLRIYQFPTSLGGVWTMILAKRAIFFLRQNSAKLISFGENFILFLPLTQIYIS